MEIGYSDFVRLFDVHDDNDWDGFRVDYAGVWVNHLPKVYLTPEEKAALTRHPEKDLSKPALAFPATRGQLNKFLAFYGLKWDSFPKLDELNDPFIVGNFDDLADYQDGLVDCDTLLVRWCGRHFDKDAFQELSDGLARLAESGEVLIYDPNDERYLRTTEFSQGYTFTGEQISRKDAERARIRLGISQHGTEFVDWHGELFISVYGAVVRMAWAAYPDKVGTKDIGDEVWIGLEIRRRFDDLEKAIEYHELDQYDPDAGEKCQYNHAEDYNLLSLSALNEWLSKNIPKIRIQQDNIKKKITTSPVQGIFKGADPPSSIAEDGPASQEVIQLPVKRHQTAEKIIQLFSECILNKPREPVLKDHAKILREMLIGFYGMPEKVPKAQMLIQSIDKAIAATGKGNNNEIPGRQAVDGVLRHCFPDVYGDEA